MYLRLPCLSLTQNQNQTQGGHSIEQRFWSKVNKHGPIPSQLSLGPCWLWTASTTRGYGQFKLPRTNGRQLGMYAHRFAWTITNGPIPDALNICHRCDVPLCVNPDHLFLGTQADNLHDGREKGRIDTTRPRVSVLTPADRQAIFDAVGARGIGIALARQYGVTKACISLIRRGRFARLATNEPQRRSA